MWESHLSFFLLLISSFSQTIARFFTNDESQLWSDTVQTCRLFWRQPTNIRSNKGAVCRSVLICLVLVKTTPVVLIGLIIKSCQEFKQIVFLIFGLLKSSLKGKNYAQPSEGIPYKRRNFCKSLNFHSPHQDVIVSRRDGRRNTAS